MHRFLLTVLLILGLTACAPVAAPAPAPAGSPTAELTRIDLGVGFVPSVQFASLYVAIAKGFFAEEGLDVRLEYGFENDYVKLVGLNERQFMIGSGDQVIIGRGQGLPVRYVMNWFTRYPVIVMAKAESGITQPTDLAGKRVGLPGPFGANYVALRAMLEAGGLSEADIKMESIGFTQAAALRQDSIDAAVDYAANGPVVLGLEGQALSVFGIDAYLPMPSNGIVTNETTLANQPDLVRGLVRGALRGVAYTLENPDEAFAIALEFVPEAGGDNEIVNRAIFDATLDFWRSAEGARPGATDPADWQASAEFMVRIGLTDAVVPAEDLATNDYLP